MLIFGRKQQQRLFGFWYKNEKADKSLMMIFAYRSQLVFLFYVPLPGNVSALYAEVSCGSGEGYIELFSSL
jgi:hypothetical protein